MNDQNQNRIDIEREKRANQLRAELNSEFGINGVAQWLHYTPSMVLISDGIKHLIENGGGKGLIDIIASYQPRMYIKEERLHQHWYIERKADHWEISMEDFYNGEAARVIQTVPISELDLVFDSFEVHLGYMDETICGICLLREED